MIFYHTRAVELAKIIIFSKGKLIFNILQCRRKVLSWRPNFFSRSRNLGQATRPRAFGARPRGLRSLWAAYKVLFF